MIFTEHHADLIRQGVKRRTTRTLLDSSGKPRREYLVGHVYAVQPGRGQPAVARIEIEDTWREQACQITPADALAEGYGSVFEYRAALDSVNGRRIPEDEVVRVYEFGLVGEADRG
jgi:hypothetical protein